MANAQPTHPVHFSKFAQAIKDILQANFFDGKKKTDFEYLKNAAISGIRVAQRFYVPFVQSLFLDRTLTEDRKQLIRLPYECIAVLTNPPFIYDFDDRIPAETGWSIAIAFVADSAFNKSFGLLRTQNQDDKDYAFGLLSLIRCPLNHPDPLLKNRWILAPDVAGIGLPSTNDGYLIGVSNTDCARDWGLANSWDKNRRQLYFESPFEVIANACTMLNLHNVKTHSVLPPEKLLKKARKFGHEPLYSYKILVVDGERWHDNGRCENKGGSFRSHLRRGHIRRLHDSERRVWVRATFVHGKSPGFVSKDYEMVAHG